MRLTPLIRRWIVALALVGALLVVAWAQARACTGGQPTWRSISSDAQPG